MLLWTCSVALWSSHSGSRWRDLFFGLPLVLSGNWRDPTLPLKKQEDILECCNMGRVAIVRECVTGGKIVFNCITRLCNLSFPYFMMKSQRFMTWQFCFSGRHSSWKEAHHLGMSSYRDSKQRNTHWQQSVTAEGGKAQREDTAAPHPQGDASGVAETDCETPEQKKSSKELF